MKEEILVEFAARKYSGDFMNGADAQSIIDQRKAFIAGYEWAMKTFHQTIFESGVKVGQQSQGNKS